ncbi:PilN domain-containing protein [Bradyrhizobium sp. dw_78]|uniref:PilN domain-containing protein n=1 Tax=Bradyrhizobium sp. dw_78 TaxID=2719793 RepID=UPI001BD45BA3|nr:PilN domain-containing protein [Bradyrhizobium sp. dw_78]
MAVIPELKQLFTEWIAAVTSAVEAATEKFVRSRRILLHEGEDGAYSARTVSGNKTVPGKKAQALPDLSFRLDEGRPHPPLPAAWQAAFRGSRVEAQLQADHVMTSLLDFPSKAGDFLDGMIRTQIDRLTPWTASDAVFGWSPPVVAANDRIDVTFAATSKREVQPLLHFAQALDVASVAIYTTASDGAGAPVRIKLLDQPWRSATGSAARTPRLLRAVLLSAGVAAAASLLISAYFESSLQSELGELQRQISQRRAALRLDSNGAGSGLELLAKRKQATPSSVMVLEAISRVLPDTTYVTELRIEGDKVQVVGMTQDAPSLIRLMEQSPQFTRATFFAPTTRAANEPGERFHIEAHITAYFGSGT